MTLPVAVSIALTSALVGLALLHVAWAWRGVSARSAALPEVDGRPAFRPGRLATLAVAAALALAAWIAAAQGELLWPAHADGLARWGSIAGGVAFAARAIGEFRLVGFFKTVRGTRFARWDTALFSPLCLALGVGFFYLAVR